MQVLEMISRAQISFTSCSNDLTHKSEHLGSALTFNSLSISHRESQLSIIHLTTDCFWYLQGFILMKNYSQYPFSY